MRIKILMLIIAICLIVEVNLAQIYTSEPNESYVGMQYGKFPLTVQGLREAIDRLDDGGVVHIAYPGIADTTGLGAIPADVNINGWLLGKFVAIQDSGYVKTSGDAIYGNVLIMPNTLADEYDVFQLTDYNYYRIYKNGDFINWEFSSNSVEDGFGRVELRVNPEEGLDIMCSPGGTSLVQSYARLILSKSESLLMNEYDGEDQAVVNTIVSDGASIVTMQVDGARSTASISISQDNTGSEVHIYGDNIKLGRDDNIVTISGVKEYVALLTQSGTDNPVVTVLKNSLGVDVTWTRTGAGVYETSNTWNVMKTTYSLTDPTALSFKIFHDGAENGESNKLIISNAGTDINGANYLIVTINVYP